MSDQPVREIQLGGKQLVFLFMASVVLAVAIFLLGISVGRGVRSASDTGAATTDVAVAEPSTLPAEIPPPTETTPADMQYHNALQGQSSAAVDPAPKPVDEPVASASTAPEPSPATPLAAAATTAAAAAPAGAPAAAPARTPAAKAAPAGSWFVQVDAFRSRDNAERQVSRLKAKSYPAMISSSAGLYRVRVGPYADRNEAERVRERLQREEGLKPSIQR